MFETSRNRFWVKPIFLVCCTLLSACTSKSKFPFLGFPILGAIDGFGEYFPLSTTARIICSIAWYGLSWAILATIPLCIASSFKKLRFYKNYKIFWRFGAFIFSLLTAILIGIIPKDFKDILIFIMCYFVILFIVLTPAYLQNKWNNPPNKTED